MSAVSPNVSIICPIFNGQVFLSGLVQSIQLQSYTNWELILIDDCSTDNSFAEATNLSANDSRIFVHRLEKKSGGPAGPRNMGIKYAKGEIIAFIDVDDRWFPEKISECLTHFSSHNFVYHDLVTMTSNKVTGRLVRGKSVLISPKISMLLRGNHIPLSSAMLKKELILKVGGFDESPNLKGVEDYDLWLRIAESKDCKFKRFGKVLGTYWVGGGNISSNSEKMSFNLRFLIEKHIKNQSVLVRYLALIRFHLSVARLQFIHSHNHNEKRFDHQANLPLYNIAALAYLAIYAFQNVFKDLIHKK